MFAFCHHRLTYEIFLLFLESCLIPEEDISEIYALQVRNLLIKYYFDAAVDI